MPVELQARIASIEARFAPSSSTQDAALGASAQSGEFAAALAQLDQSGTSALLGTSDPSSLNPTGVLSGLFGSGAQTGYGTGLTTQQNNLVASALASRNSVFGVGSVGSATGVGQGYGTQQSSRIASKATVEGIESSLSNGRLDDSQLAQIGVGSHKLHPEAAAAFKQLKAAADADGVTIGVTDSYRSYEGQVDVARRKGLYSQGGLAAKPGTSSHGYGLALDLKLDSTAQAWMRSNGARFGFVEDTPREPWHWKFDGI